MRGRDFAIIFVVFSLGCVSGLVLPHYYPEVTEKVTGEMIKYLPEKKPEQKLDYSDYKIPDIVASRFKECITGYSEMSEKDKFNRCLPVAKFVADKEGYHDDIDDIVMALRSKYKVPAE